MASNEAERAENEAMSRAFALAQRESGLSEPNFAERLSYEGVRVSKDQVHSWKTRTTVPAWIFRRAAVSVNRRMDELFALANGESDTHAAKLAALERQRLEDQRALGELRQQLAEVHATLERVLSVLGQRDGHRGADSAAGEGAG